MVFIAELTGFYIYPNKTVLEFLFTNVNKC